jgi:hypothetical protein
MFWLGRAREGADEDNRLNDTKTTRLFPPSSGKQTSSSHRPSAFFSSSASGRAGPGGQGPVPVHTVSDCRQAQRPRRGGAPLRLTGSGDGAETAHAGPAGTVPEWSRTAQRRASSSNSAWSAGLGSVEPGRPEPAPHARGWRTRAHARGAQAGAFLGLWLLFFFEGAAGSRRGSWSLEVTCCCGSPAAGRQSQGGKAQTEAGKAQAKVGKYKVGKV